MDQFVSCLGKAGHALLLDCRSLEFQQIPLPVRGAAGDLQHHGETRAFQRRLQPAAGRMRSGGEDSGAVVSGNSRLAGLYAEQVKPTAPSCRPRSTSAACTWSAKTRECWTARNTFAKAMWTASGSLMRQSHESLRDLYEVSCRELDVMVEIAEELPGLSWRPHDRRRFWRLHGEPGECRRRGRVCPRNRRPLPPGPESSPMCISATQRTEPARNNSDRARSLSASYLIRASNSGRCQRCG